jgi:hypothetical protein
MTAATSDLNVICAALEVQIAKMKAEAEKPVPQISKDDRVILQGDNAKEICHLLAEITQSTLDILKTVAKSQ